MRQWDWGKIEGMGNWTTRVPGLGESQPGAGGASLEMMEHAGKNASEPSELHK